MRIRPQTVFSFLVLLFFAVVIWAAKDWPVKAQLYPWVIGIPMLVLAAFHLVTDLRSSAGKNASPATPAEPSDSTPADIQFTREVDPVVARRRTVHIFSWIFGFLLACWLLGLSVTIPPFVFLYLKVKSGEGWTLFLVLTGAVWLLFWGLFDRLLRLPFPEGQLYLWLGL